MIKIDDRKIKNAGLIVNLVYALYNAGVGFALRSWWFITLGAYFTVLSVMRFAVIHVAPKKEVDNPDSLFAKRFSGVMLVFLSVVVAGTVILSFVTERGIKYHQILMITIALYTFSKLTIAIVNLVKSKKDSSSITKTLRNISFADAFVSIFSLQRSMLVSFEGMSEGDIKLFNLLTGTGVFIIVLLLGINLIGGKKIDMAKSKLIKANEKIADAVVGGYKKIENGVVDGYKKIEGGVVGGYKKIEDKFIDNYLTRDGESVEEARERLKNQNKK